MKESLLVVFIAAVIIGFILDRQSAHGTPDPPRPAMVVTVVSGR